MNFFTVELLPLHFDFKQVLVHVSFQKKNWKKKKKIKSNQTKFLEKGHNGLFFGNEVLWRPLIWHLAILEFCRHKNTKAWQFNLVVQIFWSSWRICWKKAAFFNKKKTQNINFIKIIVLQLRVKPWEFKMCCAGATLALKQFCLRKKENEWQIL